jgi:hypothetical protein
MIMLESQENEISHQCPDLDYYINELSINKLKKLHKKIDNLIAVKIEEKRISHKEQCEEYIVNTICKLLTLAKETYNITKEDVKRTYINAIAESRRYADTFDVTCCNSMRCQETIGRYETLRLLFTNLYICKGCMYKGRIFITPENVIDIDTLYNRVIDAASKIDTHE